jgi:hypothetical protein
VSSIIRAGQWEIIGRVSVRAIIIVRAIGTRVRGAGIWVGIIA